MATFNTSEWAMGFTLGFAGTLPKIYLCSCDGPGMTVIHIIEKIYVQCSDSTCNLLVLMQTVWML